jgi:hypothetical protein
MVRGESSSSTELIDSSDYIRREVVLAELEERQTITVALLDQARAVIDAGPTEGNRLRGLADRLQDEVHAYQLFKHCRIFDPTIAGGSPSSREAARCLKADCIAGGAAFSFSVRQWRDRDLQTGWDEFRPAVLDLGTRLRDHLKAEGVQIRLLLWHLREEASARAEV